MKQVDDYLLIDCLIWYLKDTECGKVILSKIRLEDIQSGK